jgi:hypothetical protein
VGQRKEVGTKGRMGAEEEEEKGGGFSLPSPPSVRSGLREGVMGLPRSVFLYPAVC